MNDAITVTPKSDFSDMHFTRSATGHVHSCWWSYRWQQFDRVSPYTVGSKFHDIKSRAMSAFAAALGLREDDVICSQRESLVTGDLEWRIGTIRPCELPKQKQLSQAERMLKIEKVVEEVERSGLGNVIDI